MNDELTKVCQDGKNQRQKISHIEKLIKDQDNSIIFLKELQIQKRQLEEQTYRV